MSTFKDLTGQRFGKLVVLKRTRKNKWKNWCWSCQCDCGRKTSLAQGTLQGGLTQSCGCNKLRSVGRFRSEYTIYHGAKQRCTNEKSKGFKHYGGRGIKFRFSSFPAFLMIVGRRPTRKHSLERIDVNGHYEPGNVRWATARQQARNRRKVGSLQQQLDRLRATLQKET